MTLPDFAEMVVVPSWDPAVARPALLIVAMLVADEVQSTWPVTSPVVLFPNVPVAVYCCTPAGAIIALSGDIVIDVIVSADGKKPLQPPDNIHIAHPARNARASNGEYLERNTVIMVTPAATSRRSLRRRPRIRGPMRTLADFLGGSPELGPGELQTTEA